MRARESRQRAVARGKKTLEMACKRINGEYLFHQPVAYGMNPVFTVVDTFIFPIQHLGTRKKCCIKGHLYSASDNFEEGLMMGYVLDELPAFVRKVISNSNKFSQKSSTYKNLVAMAATVVPC